LKKAFNGQFRYTAWKTNNPPCTTWSRGRRARRCSSWVCLLEGDKQQSQHSLLRNKT